MTLIRCLSSVALALLVASPARAADFAFAVNPPRFELAAQPGERLRQVLEITNASPGASTLLVRTADWRFEPDGSSVFIDELQPASCRPWVAIERRELVVAPRQAYRFRFEVAPPAGQAPVECRFAILLQGKEPSRSQSGGPSVTGRMAVIVYVRVGDVHPELEVTGGSVRQQDGRPVAVLHVRNTGMAHGRLDGFLTMQDAAGRSFEVTPASTPILPGETRGVALPLSEGEGTAVPQFPVTIRGRLEWGKDRATEVDRRFDR